LQRIRIGIHFLSPFCDRPESENLQEKTLENLLFFRNSNCEDSKMEVKKYFEARVKEAKEAAVEITNCERFDNFEEAACALEVLKRNDIHGWIFLKPDSEGNLVSGEKFEEAAKELDTLGSFGVGLAGSPTFIDKYLSKLRRRVSCSVGVLAEYDNSMEDDKWPRWIYEVHFAYACNYLQIEGCPAELLQPIAEKCKLVPSLKLELPSMPAADLLKNAYSTKDNLTF